MTSKSRRISKPCFSQKSTDLDYLCRIDMAEEISNLGVEGLNYFVYNELLRCLKGYFYLVFIRFIGRETSAITASVNQNPGICQGNHSNP